MIAKLKTSPLSGLAVYDGWPLAYDPFSPAGLHLMALLAARPGGARRLVMLPGPSKLALPEGCEILVMPTDSSPTGRLAWEQVSLPRHAARQHAGELHLTRSTLPLVGRVPIKYWPAGEEDVPTGRRPLVERLRRSLAAGGMNQRQQMVWPADLPLPKTNLEIKIEPPAVHPLFFEEQSSMDEGEPVPASYILYTGPYDTHTLRLLLAGWSWAVPSLGDETVLLLPHSQQATLKQMLVENNLPSSVRSAQPHTLSGLAALYRQAAAVVHLGQVLPWGDPVAQALAAGQALVALEEPLTAARCGPAAYLVPPENPRALGAALITLIVEESLNGQLRAAARKQVQKWGL